jgi:transposase
MTLSYRTDFSDKQWELLRPLILPAKPGERPRTVEMRAVMNALFYILVAGCAWALLPHDFPKYKTVYHYFRQWRIDGGNEGVEFMRWVMDRYRWVLETIKRSDQAKGFVLLPR